MILKTEEVYHESDDVVERLKNAVTEDLQGLLARIEALEAEVAELKAQAAATADPEGVGW